MVSSYEQHLFSSRQTRNTPLYIVLNSFSKALINCSCCENLSDILGIGAHISQIRKKYSSQRKVFLIIFSVRKLLHEAGTISPMTNGLKVFITQYPLSRKRRHWHELCTRAFVFLFSINCYKSKPISILH